MTDIATIRKWPRFSLRLLFGLTTVAALIFALIGYRNRQLARHESAISYVEECGGHPTLTQWKGNSGKILNSPNDAESTLLSAIWATPSVSVPLVDLSDPQLSATEIRKLASKLRWIIPRKDENEVGKTYVAIMLSGNPNVNSELAGEMSEALPNCKIIFNSKRGSLNSAYSR